MIAAVSQPAFYLTLAIAQAVIVIVAVRLFDRYEPEPLALIGLVALWGATGAAAISIAGNRAVKGMLDGNVQIVFGDALSAPIVEELAKGAALLVAVIPLRLLARRFGVTVFEGLNDGLVYGAAVGLGFALTEDFVFFLDTAQTQGLDAGVDLFTNRRDFFGPAVLHHAIFTAAFGAGLGLATWTARRWLRVVFPLAGLAVAVLIHAANNGLLELGLTLRYGLDTAAAWASGGAVSPVVHDAARSWTIVLGLLDYVYITVFLLAAVLWVRYEGKTIRAQLVEETESGLLSAADAAEVTDLRRRTAQAWQLVRSGQLEQWRHERQVHNLAARLALLKWRIGRFGGDSAAVGRVRRQLATLAAFEPRPSKIPAPATPLVGREPELDQAAELLRRRELRVLTLTGPGGAGKTRLAIELATRLQDRYPSGVFFVPLADAQSADAAIAAIIETLELRERPGEGPLETLKDELRDKHLLLLLDNLEQVLVVAEPLAELLRAAPRIQVVATSRERLRVAAEQELVLGPLPPDDAIELFVARARAVDLGFKTTGANREAMERICARLGGSPLAIELAAARTNVLTPTQIAARLESSLLGAAGEGSRDAPGRHQTLHATIAWSYDLLGEEERRLLARLGVFAGGFDVEATEAIAGEALGPLGSLIDKSLSRRTISGELLRFELLEAIREFALERLSEGGADLDARSLHAEYFLALAERAEPELRGAGQREWLLRLGLEHENLRVAFTWWNERGAHAKALRLAVALGPFWEQRGTLSEPRGWLESVLAADGEIQPELHARSLYGLGRLAMLQADYGDAQEALAGALTRFRDLRDADGAMRCLWELGFVALVQGDYARSHQLFEESLEAARSLGDEAAVARSLASLGRALTELGDADGARQPLRESLAIRRAAEGTRDIANSLSLLGRRALVAGELDEARASLDEAVSLARGLDDQLRLAEATYFRALVALEEADDVRAHELLAERIGLCRELGDRLGIAECFDAAARIAAGDDERAARLLAAADALRTLVGAQAWPLERERREATLSGVRKRLGERGFGDATTDGAAMSNEQAIGLALSRMGGDAERASPPTV